MASDNIPYWMRASSYRNLEDYAPPNRRAKMIVLVGLLLLFVALSIAMIFTWEDAFHLPYLAACGTALAVLIAGRPEYTVRMGLVYWVIAVGLNCLMTYIAVTEDILTYKIALAGTILFVGLSGLLILARREKELSRTAKCGIMVTILALFATSVFGFDSIPSEGVAAYARMWLFASIAPLIFLLVMTLCVLVAYHKKRVTMPYDKWI